MIGRSVLLVLLGLLSFAATVAVIDARHQSRMRFVELQELQRERDHLNEEWGRLQLEQGTLATPARIERLARQQLDMVTPGPDDILLVTP